ncbi:hypothetical protein [Francisella hispaniensis]|uniref:hypothetical protein n=1 Tax=Francisella hispaniensis TaxID=622488 RepID=UPI0019084A22|nr:hypothetical protein [Francisella hispaniensis]MBK2357403.1 hypothetical protein [Francisella hispaniensis]
MKSAMKYPVKVTEYNDDFRYLLVETIGFKQPYYTQADNIEEAKKYAKEVVELVLEDDSYTYDISHETMADFWVCIE